MRVNRMAIIKTASQVKRDGINNKNEYIKEIRREYPLEITLKQVSQEEFNQIKALSKHIRKLPSFPYYLVIDNAIAHHMGGMYWKDDEFQMESIIYNLSRLLKEKGQKPTEEELCDYIDAHSIDLKWHPEAVKIAVENLAKRLGEEDGTTN